MKTLAASLFAITFSGAAAYAADCKWGQTQYQIHWESLAMYDADPSGRPTRAYAFASDNGLRRADPIEVKFDYGMARRFQFDSPKVVETPGAIGGAMVIAQNLLEPFEATQTHIKFDRPVTRFSIALHDVDDNAKFGRSYKDHLAFVGRSPRGNSIIPEISLFDTPEFEAKGYLAYESERGLAGDNIYPLPLVSADHHNFAPIEATFQAPITMATLYFSSGRTKGSSYSMSQNPRPQEIMLGKATFCVK